MAQPNQPPAPPDASGDSNKRWLAGCGIGCLVMVLLLAAGMVGGYFWVRGKINDLTAELEAEGFRRHAIGQVVEVTEEITDKALLIGQQVTVKADSRADLAIIAQNAEIYGTVAGNVTFWGQMLTIRPTAEITGDVHALAQSVVNEGVVRGEIGGVAQSLTTGGGGS